MPVIRPDQSSGGGGGGGVQSVSAADTSVVVAGTATDPTIRTADLSAIAADHATAGDVAMGAHKLTGLANGVAASDAAALGQVGVTSLAAADTSLVVGGTAAAPTVRTGTLDVIAADHPPAADWSNNGHKLTGLANGVAASDALAVGQVLAAGALPIADIADPGTGKVIGSSGGAAAAILPSGFLFDYAQITANVSVTGTSSGAPTTVITGASVIYDGATLVRAEFYSVDLLRGTSSISVGLYQDGVLTFELAFNKNLDMTCMAACYFTPSAAAHVYSIRAWTSGGTGTIGAGTGAASAPAYLRITKA